MLARRVSRPTGTGLRWRPRGASTSQSQQWLERPPLVPRGLPMLRNAIVERLAHTDPAQHSCPHFHSRKPLLRFRPSPAMLFRSMVGPFATTVVVSLLATIAAAAAAASSSPSPSDFKVHSISVEHQLGGSIHTTSQLHLVEQPNSTSDESLYFIGLSPEEAAALSWSEVNLKLGPGIAPDQRATVDLDYQGSLHHGSAASEITHLYSLQLPPRFLEQADPELDIGRSNITIAIDLVFHHLSEALPKAVAQKEEASLLWKGDAVPRTVYGAGKTRVKAR